MSIKNQPLQFNKINFHNLEQEKNMLKVTLEYLSSENLKLKQQVEDMRITVRHNKEQLDEYVTKITNKDKVFEKMNSQIEQLTSRLKTLETKNRYQMKKSQNDQIDLKIPSIASPLLINNLATTNATTILNNKDDINKGLSNTTTKKSEDKAREFFSKQAEILEEMNILKDDVQFLLENKTKTKMREHLDNSINSNRSFNSSNNNNVSVSHSNRIINNNNALNDSVSLNSSMASNLSTHTIKKRFNLKERFNLDSKFSQFLLEINSKKSIVLMIDNKGTIWELIKRKDLSMTSIKNHPEYIKSIVQNHNDIDKNTAYNTNNLIDSKDYDNRSLKQSEFDLSKSDFNLSKMIKESELI